jgi:hypothetical protein
MPNPLSGTLTARKPRLPAQSSNANNMDIIECVSDCVMLHAGSGIVAFDYSWSIVRWMRRYVINSVFT